MTKLIVILLFIVLRTEHSGAKLSYATTTTTITSLHDCVV